jgi:hypothetical protein
VTIVNEVDSEEVPGVPEDFQYLEHGYDWGKYASDTNFLIGCECADNCTDIESCCFKHIDSDHEELRGFWYDKLVRFPCGLDYCVTRLTSSDRAISVSVPPTYYSGNATK